MRKKLRKKLEEKIEEKIEEKCLGKNVRKNQKRRFFEVKKKNLFYGILILRDGSNFSNFVMNKVLRF